MPGADFDDPSGTPIANDGIGGQRVQAGEPGLIETRASGLAGQRQDVRRQRLDRRDQRGEAGLRRAKIGRQRRIGDGLDRGGVSIGQKEAFWLQTENGRKSHHPSTASVSGEHDRRIGLWLAELLGIWLGLCRVCPYERSGWADRRDPTAGGRPSTIEFCRNLRNPGRIPSIQVMTVATECSGHTTT